MYSRAWVAGVGGGGGEGEGGSRLSDVACGAKAGSVARLVLRRSRGGEAAGEPPEAGEAPPLDAGRSPPELGVRGSPGIASLSFPHSSSSPVITNLYKTMQKNMQISVCKRSEQNESM